MDITLKDEGLSRLLKSLEYEPLARTLEQAVFMTANAVLNDAKKITPVEFGDLVDSGRVEQPELTSKGISVRITFGGPSAPYALIVHEDMRPKNWSKPGTGPKFLETPARAWEPKFLRSVKARYASYLRRG